MSQVDVGDPQSGELAEPQSGAYGQPEQVGVLAGQPRDGRELKAQFRGGANVCPRGDLNPHALLGH